MQFIWPIEVAFRLHPGGISAISRGVAQRTPGTESCESNRPQRGRRH